MNRISYIALKVLAFVLVVGIFVTITDIRSAAAACVQTGSGTWSATASFTGCSGAASAGAGTGNRPGAGEALTANAGLTLTVDVNTPTIASYTISTSGVTATTLTINSGASLTISGTFTVPQTTVASTTQTFSILGTLDVGALTFTGTTSGRNTTISIDNAAGKFKLRGTMTVSSGGTKTVKSTAAGTVELISATIPNTSTLTWGTFAAGTNLVNTSGSSSIAKTTAIATWGNCTITAGTLTTAALYTCTGNLTNNGTWAGTGGVTLSNASALISGTGSITNSGIITISGATAPTLASGSSQTFNNLTLAANALFTVNGTLTISNALTIAAITSTSKTPLTIGSTGNLTVTGTTAFTLAAAALTSTIDVGAGTVTFGGTLTMTGSTTSSIGKIILTSGTINFNAGINTSGTTSGTAADHVIDITGGAGTINAKGQVMTANSFTASGWAFTNTTCSGAGNTFVYADIGNAQTVGAPGSGGYCNLTILSGVASQATAFDVNSVKGNIVIGDDVNTVSVTNLSGTITGNAGKTFTLNNLATYKQTNTSAERMPTGFGTITLDANSTVEYDSTAGYTISSTYSFGNLAFKPTTAGLTFTLPSSVSIAGDLVVGNGTNAVTVNANTNDPTLNIPDVFTINDGGTFIASSTSSLTVGSTMTIGGGTSGTFTENGGNIDLNGNLVINAGATFTKNASSQLQFTGGTAQTITDNTATKQDLGTVVTSSPTGATTTSYLIDLGRSDTQTATTGWNNFNDPSVMGSASALVDSTGAASSATFQITNSFYSQRSNCANLDDCSNNNGTTSSSLYPANATHDSFFLGTLDITDNSATVVIGGLNNANTYDFKFYASRVAGDAGDRNTNYTINGNTVTLNATDNVDNTVQLTGVSPTSGAITISIVKGASATFGYLGVLEITEHGTGTLATTVTTATDTQLTSLNIGASSTFNISTDTMTVSGTSGTLIANSGTFTTSGSTVVLAGAGTKTLASGVSSINNLTVSGTGTTSLASDLTIGGALTMSAGTLQLGTNNVTVSGTTALNGGSIADSSTTGTNTFTGMLTVNGGTWDESGNAAYSFDGGVTMLSGTWSGGSGTKTITSGGLTVSGGSYTSGSGTYAFSTNSQTMGGSSAYTVTNVSNTITTGSGLVISGSDSTIGTLTQGTNSILTFSGAVPAITTLTATANPNTVAYTSTGAQTVIATTYNDVTINKTAGTATLGGSGFVAADTFTLTAGTFDANNQNLSMKNFANSNSNTRAISMGSGTWTITGTGTAWDTTTTTGLTVTPGTSTIKFTDSSATLKTFSGGGVTYNNIWFAPGTGTGTFEILGSNTFNDFKDDGTVAHSILFQAGTTQTVTTFTVSGNAGQLITINSSNGSGSTSTSTHTLSAGGGTVTVDYLNIQHSVATSGTWDAGSHSTDNNSVATAGSGWSFTAATQGPYGGTPWTIPGTIQFEDYDTGGQGVAYNDTDPLLNQAGQYRPSEGVDIEATQDITGSYNLGWVYNTEWTEYTVNVTTAGTYTLSVRVASLSAGNLVTKLDGSALTTVTTPSTGGYQVWQTATSSNFTLSSGSHILRIEYDNNLTNYNYMTFNLVAASGCVSTATGNWNDSTKWNCGHVPTTGDDVTITSGHTITMNVDSAVVGNITVNGTLNTSGYALSGTSIAIGASGALSAGSSTITLSGTSGTLLSSAGGTFTPSSSTLVLSGNGTAMISSGVTTLNSVSLTGTGTKYIGAATTLNGSLTIGATSTFGAGFDMTVSGSVTNNGTYVGEGWQYSKMITIDHTKVPNTDQTNFPVLINGIYTDLKSVAYGGHVFSNSGYDIAFFSDPALTTPLKWEVETYTPTSGLLIAWVKVPSLSHTTDTSIYMGYGNIGVTTDQSDKNNVWDSNYKAVWHLDEPVSGNGQTLANSTSFSENLTTNSSSTYSGVQSTAPVGSGMSINKATNDYLSFPQVTLTGAWTIEGWVKLTTSPDQYSSMFGNGTSGGGSVFNTNWFSGLYRAWDGSSDDIVATTSISSGTWYHYAITRSGTAIALYLNGNSDKTGTGGKNAVFQQLGVNADGSTSNTILFDEVRISTAQRSADWVKTEYNNQNSPSTFYTIGTETSVTSLSSSTLSIAGSWTNTGTYSASGATIKMTDNSGNPTFAGGGATYTKLWFAPGAGTGSYTISGNNTFGELKDDGSAAHTVKFTAGSTQTITTWSISGTSGNLITIDSTTTGTHNLVKADGAAQTRADYLNIKHSVASPVDSWYAGDNSVNNQDIATAGSGWIFTTQSKHRGGGGSVRSAGGETDNGTGTGTCADGVQNGNETGVDTGGRCANTGGGNGGGGTVDNGTGTGTCSDQIQNGNETGVDTGGRCANTGGGNGGGGGGDVGFLFFFQQITLPAMSMWFAFR